MKKILLFMIILCISLYATPITLNNTGLITKLEKFIPICTYYSKTIKHPYHIRQQCQRYKNNLNTILKIGYRLDRNIVPQKHTHMYNGKIHTCTNQSLEVTSYNSAEFNNYRKKLLQLDKFRRQIIGDISKEKTRARRAYDTTYHEKLIRKNIIKLYESDKIFMREHRDTYANNPRYIKMMKDKDEALLSQKERDYLASIREEEKRKKEKEHAKWMEMCGYNMTSIRHDAKLGGKITGKVIGADVNGYFVETRGGYGSSYYVIGGPLHTRGEYITTPIYVKSRAERISSTTTNMKSGVKTNDAVLLVYYNDQCYNK